MNTAEQPPDGLKQLAAHLALRRESILLAWRRAVDADPELTMASTITRAQFIDHIPAVLDAFEHRLSAQDASDRDLARIEQKESAGEHGLHRWQQGYNQPDTMCEWGHLHLCLLQELESYQELNAGLEPAAMQRARRELVRLCSDGVCASASRYARLQQSEAATRVRELEAALAHLRLLDQGRAEAWREAAHDLRGRAHVIAHASAVLTRADVPEQLRPRFSEMLKLSVQSLDMLLTDLMDQARLEAGHERRQITHFDVASRLKEFCDTARPLAGERNLFLVAKGPASLMVDGDAEKIQRIVQNLVLNALKVTEEGGIKVTWEAGANDRRPQWALCVQDTGPGFERGSATPLERVLKRATTEAHEVEHQNLSPSQAGSLQSDSAPTLASQSSHPRSRLPSGEGIGLSIVKRLCEMLDASLELESSKGEGTTFRVIFPRRYAGPANEP
ncbi:MAG TPA: sensor histidine kinase [Steroidobacteraceae bacterium]|nr:sensor histidine kinase [Steroidobacteraceae bacterium]